MGWHTSHCSFVNSDLTASIVTAYMSNPTAFETIPNRPYFQHETTHRFPCRSRPSCPRCYAGGEPVVLGVVQPAALATTTRRRFGWRCAWRALSDLRPGLPALRFQPQACAGRDPADTGHDQGA